MKKLLLLLLVVALQLNADKVLIAGISNHSKNVDIDGRAVNERNVGFGYQLMKKDVDTYESKTLLVLKDSFNNPMVSYTYGIGRIVKNGAFDIYCGFEFGIGARKIIVEEYIDIEDKDLGTTSEYQYRIIPIVALPTVTISVGKLSISALYLPKLKVRSVEAMGATLFMMGYEF